MAKAKILTREEKLKKTYNELYNLNQKLKNISSLYYIGEDGVIYMKSSVRFLESFATLRYPDKLELFQKAIVTPNAFFDFGKRLKKSKLEIHEIEDQEGYRFELCQSDCEDLKYTLNILNYTTEEVKEKMGYKRIFEIQDKNKYDVFDSDYYPLDVDQVEALCNGKYIEVTLPTGDIIPFTKHLFMDIKNGDYIQIAKMARQKLDEEKGEYRAFFLISHDTDLYTSYTIFNKISSI